MAAQYQGKDQHWQEERTVYWFALDGTDPRTGVDFNGEVFGIAESGDDSTIVDSDGAPLTEGDHQTIAVRNLAQVTQEMRQAQ